MEDLTDWKPCPLPDNHFEEGRYVKILPWSGKTCGKDLWNSFGGFDTNTLLFHFGWPQMKCWQDLADILDRFNQSGEFVTCIFADKLTEQPLGMASYMSIVPEHGVIETGAIAHGSKMAKSRTATEGHYLMARRVFEDWGYRRYEWKLNNPNEPSHRAAKRFGFSFEGVFRQHQVKPYGNRDTAWYSMLDKEWPNCKSAFETWLHEDNFDNDGIQINSLEVCRSRD